ncbi:MAG: lysophospholipid acyltransferase family protein [Terriglobales bacterium]
MNATAPTATSTRAEPQERVFTWRQRVLLSLISWVAALALRLIGPTLRYRVSFEEGGPPSEVVHPGIYVFWHRCVFAATYCFRNHGIAVMTSRSFDGEYIARIIERFGFSAVRGSSSRGAVRALLGMHKIVERGQAVAFTIDGPRGPRYVAKPGPVLLARHTGVPIIAFHLAVENVWVLNSWDGFMIPKPFSRVLMRVSKLIQVPPDANSDAMARYHAEMQAALERVRDFADANVGIKPTTETQRRRENQK